MTVKSGMAGNDNDAVGIDPACSVRRTDPRPDWSRTAPRDPLDGGRPMRQMSARMSTPAPPRALWYAAPGQIALREAVLAVPGPDEALIGALWSGVSRGTERLILHGRVPASEHERMRGPAMEGRFPFPVKYGYCAVGCVLQGPAEWLGRTVFALHPHQERFVLPVTALTHVPAAVPARRATLAANMETALNAVWDSGLAPGDRVVVVGAGIVGLLVASIAARTAGVSVTLVDPQTARAPIAAALGANFTTPDAVPGEADIVFHASASEGGLAIALAAAGFEATVVELSWYGDRAVAAPLGQAFHSRRLKLISSQVGHVSDRRRARWGYARRMETAMALLSDDRLDLLIGDEVPFGEAPARLPALLSQDATGLGAVLRY
jgi:hypothetical protein